MLNRNPSQPRRSCRLQPLAEGLETRQLLSSGYGTPTAQVSGTDPDGAHWTLRLYGPGTLNVVDQNGTPFTKANSNTPDSIDTITVGGTDNTTSRLVGTVTPAPDGNSNVYFQNLVVTPSGQLGKIDLGQVSNFRQQQLGISAIDIPDFYLAHTETAKPSTASSVHTGAELAGQIQVPGGVQNLRFGGVEADYTSPGGTPLNQTGQSNEFVINLGIPIITGTSIIVNNVTSDAEANSTSGSPAFQDMVTFLVAGRLNLFQANSISGNTTTGLVPSQFAGAPVSSSDLSPGGTYVASVGSEAGTGQIGNVRVGGNATNFTTLVDEYTLSTTPVEGALDAKISNFFIGGETNNVMMIAPSGSRNVAFGLGMDNVTINSLIIQNLRANRDATNSTLTVSRSIQNMLIGGNVENTNIQAGYSQSLFEDEVYPATSVLTAASGVFYGTPPPTITNRMPAPETGYVEPFAQNGGSIAGRIAGNIVNSVISASVDPNPSNLTPSFIDDSGVFQPRTKNIFPYNAPNSLYLARGVINLKFEGTVDNSASPLLADGTPVTAAFFARVVHIKKGPVIPPSVPYEPYVAPTVYHRGQSTLKGLFKLDHIPSNLKVLRTAQRLEEHKSHEKK
jgi:hypothetical protein